MPHSRTTYDAHKLPPPPLQDQTPTHQHKINSAPLHRASRSLESWLLSDLGRLSMTPTSTPNPTSTNTNNDNDRTRRPKSPRRIRYAHTHCTCSSSLCEHSCSSSLASESSFLRSRGWTPSTSSSSSSGGSAGGSVEGGGEDGDGLPTYRSAVELQGRGNDAVRPFAYERREVVQVLREVESGSGSDDGLERERGRGRGRRKRFWR